MTELGDIIADMIRAEGPITVERYMELALIHPEFGYYMTRDPFGAAGDFTTSPEISQMFGELCGLWAAEVWTAMGSPNPVHLIELGPGRGTLMSDALRAGRIVPEFRAALDVTLVEASPVLANIQHEALVASGAAISWAPTLAEAPEGPAIVIANEFLDALPVRQYVMRGGRWRERLIRLNPRGGFAFDVKREAEQGLPPVGDDGDILEINASAHRLVYELSHRLARQGGAALFVDYGHVVTSLGDTLQAVKQQRPVDPLGAPGEADLTAHVDFSAMARSARAAGAAVYGPIEQGDFLEFARALGPRGRAQRTLARSRGGI